MMSPLVPDIGDFFSPFTLFLSTSGERFIGFIGTYKGYSLVPLIFSIIGLCSNSLISALLFFCFLWV